MFIPCKAWRGWKKVQSTSSWKHFLMQIKLLVEGQESSGLSRLGKFSCSYNDHLLWKLIWITLSRQFVLLSLFIFILQLLQPWYRWGMEVSTLIRRDRSSWHWTPKMGISPRLLPVGVGVSGHGGWAQHPVELGAAHKHGLAAIRQSIQGLNFPWELNISWLVSN